MLKFGIVINIDESKAQARVQFYDEDEMSSYWLSVLQSKTLKDKFYILPDTGEHVVCLMDENSEEGVILGAIYSEADTCPISSKDKILAKFSDGTSIEIDKSQGNLTINVINFKLNGKFILNGIDLAELFNSHNHNETDSVTQTPNQRLL
ncbi:MAG: phage baseplate assembly protein V [Candidatus Gastranaerophilales bacterium]|nr:phage baseplate assembly protein V [Candidatus Gastranaerophilales bacterium]